MFRLKVKQINGDIIVLELEEGDNSLVIDVKNKLSSIVEAEIERIRLIYIGRVLKDDERLRDYRVTEESTIQCIIRPIETNHSNIEPERTIPDNIPQFRSLGSGIVMGSITLDGSNISTQGHNLQNIIGQMVSLAQNFTSSDNHTSRASTIPLSSNSSSSNISSNPINTNISSSSSSSTTTTTNDNNNNTNNTPIQSSSGTNHNSINLFDHTNISLTNAHLQSIMHSLQQNSSQFQSESHSVVSNLNNLFLVLHNLEIPLMNILRQLPQNDSNPTLTSLPIQTISEIINLSNQLRSLSLASSMLSSTLQSLTSPPPSILSSNNIPASSHSFNNFFSTTTTPSTATNFNNIHSAAPAPLPSSSSSHCQTEHISLLDSSFQNLNENSNHYLEERDSLLDDISIEEIFSDP